MGRDGGEVQYLVVHLLAHWKEERAQQARWRQKVEDPLYDDYFFCCVVSFLDFPILNFLTFLTHLQNPDSIHKS